MVEGQKVCFKEPNRRMSRRTSAVWRQNQVLAHQNQVLAQGVSTVPEKGVRTCQQCLKKVLAQGVSTVC